MRDVPMMPKREELVTDIARMMVPIQTTAQRFSQTLMFIPAPSHPFKSVTL
jgi:hypothetical protein